MIGKDQKNQIWFKSDQFLTRITTAEEFRVKKCWFRKKWKLYAMERRRHWFTQEIHLLSRLIGVYKSEFEASECLYAASRALNIELIEEKTILDRLTS